VVPEPRSAYALQFFLLAATSLIVGIVVALMLIKVFPSSPTSPANHFPAAFGMSTCLLFSGSWSLYRAVAHVRREQQAPFRRRLMLALTAGTMFVGVQTYALTSLIRKQPPDDASTGAAAFVAVFAALHAMHFIVALLCLCYVTVQASADRYDHEYYWGVTICAWFWHILGIVWLTILFLMMIVRFYNEPAGLDLRQPDVGKPSVQLFDSAG
jgi:cytochrome c oxidase subunit 3